MIASPPASRARAVLVGALVAVLAAVLLPLSADTASGASPAPTDPGSPPIGVTGGAGRPSVAVTSLADSGPGTLRAALEAGGGMITFSAGLTGTIALASPLRVPSDTTIEGGGAAVTLTRHTLRISGVHNVVVRHLRFTAQSEGVGTDAVWVDGSSDVWVDHNTFSNASDGLVDVTRSATRVTISWNRFESHRKTMLLGSATAGGTPDLTDISVHHNLLLGTSERNPMMRHARFHVVNNVLDDWGSSVTGYGIGVDCGADARIEGNIFDAGANTRAVDGSASGCDATRQPRATLVDNALRGGSRVEATAEPSSLPRSEEPVPEPASADLEAAVRAGAGWGASAPLPVVPRPTDSVGLSPGLSALDGRTVSVSWTALPDVAAYDLQLVSCDGTRIWHSERKTTVTEEISSLPPGCWMARVRTSPLTDPAVLVDTPWEGSPEVTVGTGSTTSSSSTTSTTVSTSSTAAGSLRPVLHARSSSSVRLSWTAVPGADRYRWQLLTCSGTVVVSSDTTATTKDRSGLAPGCYRGSVRARVGGSYRPAELSNDLQLGTTATTAAATTTTSTSTSTVATTTTTAASSTTSTTAPTGTVMAPKLSSKAAGSLTLSWNAVSGGLEYRWRILTCAGALVVQSDTTATSKTISGRPPGCYVGEVHVRRASGWSAAERSSTFAI